MIPARDEAGVIARRCSRCLRQTGITPLHIFVVDDNSSDGTAEIARSAAPDDDRLTVIDGKPLPPGWSGKVWAMQQGVEQALSLKPEFLLLTDADIEHSPDGIARLADLAEGGYDLASFMVKLHCETLAEKLLIPAFVFFFFLLYPPQWIRDPRRKTAGAAGGCMLIRPEALQRAGGMEAIRHEIIDDCALARAVKHSGGNVWLGVTQDTISMRPYDSFAEIERMVDAHGVQPVAAFGWCCCCWRSLGLVLAYVVPLALLFSGSRALTLLGAAAYFMMFVAYLPMVRFYRLNWLWALTLPLSAMFYMAASIHSAVKYWSGRGGEWKGRAQDNV